MPLKGGRPPESTQKLGKQQLEESARASPDTSPGLAGPQPGATANILKQSAGSIQQQLSPGSKPTASKHVLKPSAVCAADPGDGNQTNDLGTKQSMAAPSVSTADGDVDSEQQHSTGGTAAASKQQAHTSCTPRNGNASSASTNLTTKNSLKKASSAKPLTTGLTTQGQTVPSAVSGAAGSSEGRATNDAFSGQLSAKKKAAHTEKSPTMAPRAKSQPKTGHSGAAKPAVPPSPKQTDSTVSTKTRKEATNLVGKSTIPPSPGQTNAKKGHQGSRLPPPAFADTQPAVQMVSPPTTAGSLPAPAGLGLMDHRSNKGSQETQKAQRNVGDHLDAANEVLRSVEAAKQRVQSRIRAIARDRLAMAQSEAAHNSLALQEMMEAKASMQAALDRAEQARIAAEVDAQRRRQELTAAAAVARAAHDEALLLHDEDNSKVLQEIVSKHKAAQSQLKEIEQAIQEQEAAQRQAGTIHHNSSAAATPPSPHPNRSTDAAQSASPKLSSPLMGGLPTAGLLRAPIAIAASDAKDASRLSKRIAAIQSALNVLEKSADFESSSTIFIALRQELAAHRNALSISKCPTSAGSALINGTELDTQTSNSTATSPVISIAGASTPIAPGPSVAPLPVNHADELLNRLAAYETQMQQQSKQLQSMRKEMDYSSRCGTSPAKSEQGTRGANGAAELLASSASSGISAASSRSASPPAAETNAAKRPGSMFADPLGYYVPAMPGMGPRLSMDVEPSRMIQSLGIDRKLSIKLSAKAQRRLHSIVEDNLPKFAAPRETRQLDRHMSHLSSVMSSHFARSSGTGYPLKQLVSAPSVQMASMLAPQDCASTIAMVLQGTVHRRVHVLLKQIGRRMTSTEQHAIKLLRQTAQQFSASHRTKQLLRGSVAMAGELAAKGRWEDSERLLRSLQKKQGAGDPHLRTIEQVKETIDLHYVEMLQQRSGADDYVLQAEAELHALLSAVAHAFYSQARREIRQERKSPKGMRSATAVTRRAAEQDLAFKDLRDSSSSSFCGSLASTLKQPSVEEAALSQSKARERDQLEAEIMALSGP